MVFQAVVQERDVVVESDRPTASPRRRFLVQLLVVGEVVQDLVVVGLGVVTRAAAVAEDQLLFGPVTQAQVCHVEVDLFKEAATPLTFDPVVSAFLSAAASPATPLPVSAAPCRPLGVCCSFLSPSVPLRLRVEVHVGRPAQAADSRLDEVHDVLELLRVKAVYGVFKREKKISFSYYLCIINNINNNNVNVI